MSNEKYLRELLNDQILTETEKQFLKDKREEVQSQLQDKLKGNPVFYYGGSYAKKTIIRESYDLDLVLYWPQNTGYSLKSIFKGVGDILNDHWENVYPKKVAWHIPFEGDFHIDVVPGIALDPNNRSANLYNNDDGSSLKTGLKIHIDHVKNSGRIEAIKLMKLWKKRKNLPLKSFILELMTIKGCEGKSVEKLESQLLGTLNHIYRNISHIKLIDPANQNNIISRDMTEKQKKAVRDAAGIALDKKTPWTDVFTQI